MDVKRTVITLILITGIWLVWMQFFSKPQAPSVAPQPPPVTAVPHDGAAGGPAPSPAAKDSPAAKVDAPPAEKPVEEKVELETSQWKATFSTYGGTLVSFELRDPQYREKGEKGEQQVQLVKRPKDPPLQTTFQTPDLAIAADAVWKVDSRSAQEVVFVREDAVARVVKRYSTAGASSRYDLALAIEVENRKAQPLSASLQIRISGWHDFHGPKGSFFRPPPNMWEAGCFHGERTQRPFDDLVKDGPFEASPPAKGAAKWAGVADRYFLLGAASATSTLGVQPGCRLEVTDAKEGTFAASMTFGAKEIAPSASEKYRFAIYGGPKLLRELDAVKVQGSTEDPQLAKAVDYGVWGPICRVMLGVLVAVNSGVGSWGLAIIALTLLVKLLTFPLTQKSIRAGREMAKLKPKMEELQKRYKDDKARLNQEVMGLYKTHGVNPIGSCLPMLIQLPVWWALYSTLNNAVELYRSTFLWMPDLTQPDPYYITPLAMGVFMFLQQKITPMPTDSEQQRIMMYTMPIVFTFMSLLFPAGLTVYILTNTLLSMLQQYFSNRSAEPVKTPAKAK